MAHLSGAHKGEEVVDMPIGINIADHPLSKPHNQFHPEVVSEILLNVTSVEGWVSGVPCREAGKKWDFLHHNLEFFWSRTRRTHAAPCNIGEWLDVVRHDDALSVESIIRLSGGQSPKLAVAFRFGRQKLLYLVRHSTPVLFQMDRRGRRARLTCWG